MQWFLTLLVILGLFALAVNGLVVLIRLIVVAVVIVALIFGCFHREPSGLRVELANWSASAT